MHHLRLWTTGVAALAASVAGCESQERADERLETVPPSLRAPADTEGTASTAPVAPQTGDGVAPAPDRLNDSTIDVGGGTGLGGTAGGVDAQTREEARQEIRAQTPDVERRRDNDASPRNNTTDGANDVDINVRPRDDGADDRGAGGTGNNQ